MEWLLVKQLSQWTTAKLMGITPTTPTPTTVKCAMTATTNTIVERNADYTQMESATVLCILIELLALLAKTISI
jgi:hypothetical protein